MGVRIDQPMDMLFEFRAEHLGLLAAAEVAGIQAADARAEFGEPGGDRVAAPAERRLGEAGGAPAVLVGHLRLETPPSVPGQESGGRDDSLNGIVREQCHNRLLREKTGE